MNATAKAVTSELVQGTKGMSEVISALTETLVRNSADASAAQKQRIGAAFAEAINKLTLALAETYINASEAEKKQIEKSYTAIHEKLMRMLPNATHYCCSNYPTNDPMTCSQHGGVMVCIILPHVRD